MQSMYLEEVLLCQSTLLCLAGPHLIPFSCKQGQIQPLKSISAHRRVQGALQTWYGMIKQGQRTCYSAALL